MAVVFAPASMVDEDRLMQCSVRPRMNVCGLRTDLNHLQRVLHRNQEGMAGHCTLFRHAPVPSILPGCCAYIEEAKTEQHEQEHKKAEGAA